MKQWPSILCMLLWSLCACDGGGSSAKQGQQEPIAPREATDPVPEPPTHADTSGNAAAQADEQVNSQTSATREVYYRLTGTEPFWSLTLGRPYSTYRSMEGDSLSFSYQEPRQAAGRPGDWAQVFPLDDKGWVLLRKEKGSCSDGMSDRAYPYTATVWINEQLLDGCATKE